MKRKNEIILYGGVGLFLMLQVYLFFFLSFDTRDDFSYINEEPVPLFGETRQVSQEFRSPGELTRIDVLMANYKTVPGAGTLQLGIYQNNRCLFLKNMPANTVLDNRFLSFSVPPGKIGSGQYEMRLSFDRKNKNDRLAVWTTGKNLYPHGRFLVNGKQRKGDMTFRVFYRSTIWQARDRWLHGLPGFSGRGFLLGLVLLVLLAGVNAGFYYGLRKTMENAGRK